MSRPCDVKGGLFLLFIAVAGQAHAAVATPDFSGVWFHARGTAIGTPQPPTGGKRTPPAAGASKSVPGGSGEFRNALTYTIDGSPPPLQPWAANIFKQYTEAMEQGSPLADPVTRCLPAGNPVFFTQPYPYQIVQTADQLTIISEANREVLFVYLNAQHPADLKRSWYGHSIGRWESDTLVVDTIGQTDKTLFSGAGIPKTNALHLIERIRLVNGGQQLEIRMLVDDPGAFTHPWETLWRLDRRTDIELLEYICAENEKDTEHMTVGPTTKPLKKAE